MATHDRRRSTPTPVAPVLVNWWPEGAQALGVGRTRMAELIATKQIKSCKLGRKRLIRVEELHRFAEQLAAEQQGAGAA